MKVISTKACALLCALAATGATAGTFSVVDNPGGQFLPNEFGIASFDSYGSTLTTGDSVSVTFNGEGTDSFVGLGFVIAPLGSFQNFELAFTTTDLASFGPTTMYLSSSTSQLDAFASAQITQSGQVVSFGGIAASSPVYLLYDFTNASQGSFTGDFDLLQPVPVPAGLGLTVSGMALMGWVARRRRRS